VMVQHTFNDGITHNTWKIGKAICGNEMVSGM